MQGLILMLDLQKQNPYPNKNPRCSPRCEFEKLYFGDILLPPLYYTNWEIVD